MTNFFIPMKKKLMAASSSSKDFDFHSLSQHLIDVTWYKWIVDKYIKIIITALNAFYGETWVD